MPLDASVEDRLAKMDPAVAARARAVLEGGSAAPQAAPASSGGGWGRTVAQGLGALGGGALGGLGGGPLGAAGGALGGAGLVGTAADILSGEADPARILTQGVLTAATLAAPELAALSPAKQVLTSGLMQSLGGQVYDFAKDAVTGKFRTLKDATGQTLRDFAGGVFGQSLGTGREGPAAARQGARETALASQAARREQFAQAGITPKASEITDSGVLSSLESFPERFPIGRGPMDRLEALRHEQAQGAVQQSVGDISPAGITSEQQAGTVVGDAVEQSLSAARTRWGQAFDSAEAVTGAKPVVPSDNLVKALHAEFAAGSTRPSGPGAYTQRLIDELGLPPRSAAAIVEGAPLTVPEARAIESELGQIGFRGRAPVGATPAQRRAARLYSAHMEDWRTFFSTDEGGQVQPQLQAAKQQFKDGLALYNDSKVRDFLSAKKTPEEAVRRAFRPGAVTDTEDLKRAVPKDVYDQAVQGWMHGLYVKAGGETEQFSPVKFANEVRRYDQNGHLDVILGADKAGEVRNLADVFTTMKQSGAAGGRGGSPTASHFGTGMQFGAAPLAIMQSLMAGHPLGAAAEAVTAYGVPAGLGRMTTSPGGINALTSLATPGMRPSLSMTPAARTLSSVFAGKGLADTPMPEWLRQLGAPGPAAPEVP